MRSNSKLSGGSSTGRGRKNVSAGRGSDAKTPSRVRRNSSDDSGEFSRPSRGAGRASAGRTSAGRSSEGTGRTTGTRGAGRTSAARGAGRGSEARGSESRGTGRAAGTRGAGRTGAGRGTGAGRTAGTRTAGARGASTRSTGTRTAGTRGASSRGAERSARGARGTERVERTARGARGSERASRGAERSFETRETRQSGSRSFGFMGGKETLSGNRPFSKREISGGKVVERRGNVQSYTPKSEDKEIRLNKFISNSGICSRREADSYITAGLVTVNGVVVTELGTKVKPEDDVRFNGERLKGEEKVYIVMNKPKDFVTTTSDPHAEKTVMDLISGKCASRVYPVGRLDKATTGVLLFTNDGMLADKLMHPSFEKKKIYQVTIDKNLKGSDFQALVEGINLEDGFIKADELAFVDGDKTQIGIEIHSGRNRIIRRMFESLGYKIKKLDRVYFAGLTKKNLRRGQWRFLTEQEVAMLLMGSYE